MVSILSGYVKERDKIKSLEDEGSAPQSAFLGPTLWDKTLSYDGDNFQLEYMDLEEFLSENGIPSSPAQHDQSLHRQQQQQAPIQQGPISVMDLSSRSITSIHTGMVPQNCLHSPSRPGKVYFNVLPYYSWPICCQGKRTAFKCEVVWVVKGKMGVYIF